MNQYNDKSFFEEYSKMDRSTKGLVAAGEWPQMSKLLTKLEGANVLDLGCGYGWHARYCIENGADYVLGIDGSSRMLEKAKSMTNDDRILYKNVNIEDFVPEKQKFDIVVSNLSLHYIQDLKSIFSKIYDTLKPGGYFVMNIEHPVFTAGVNQTFVETLNSKYWPVDQYFIEGERQTEFLGKNVSKQHHTLTTILNGLIQCGFTLGVVEEVQPEMEIIEKYGWYDELKRPMMLLVKATK